MIPSSRWWSLATSISAVRGGRSPAQAGSRCVADPEKEGADRLSSGQNHVE